MKQSILVDTSVWVEVWRTKTTERSAVLRRQLEDVDVVGSRLVQLEILAGSLNDEEWAGLRQFFGSQVYLPIREGLWEEAARLFFDLRRRGLTVRSLVDCCIAQQAIDHDVLLLHRDRDFQAIASLRPLRQRYLDL